MDWLFGDGLLYSFIEFSMSRSITLHFPATPNLITELCSTREHSVWFATILNSLKIDNFAKLKCYNKATLNYAKSTYVEKNSKIWIILLLFEKFPLFAKLFLNSKCNITLKSINPQF